MPMTKLVSPPPPEVPPEPHAVSSSPAAAVPAATARAVRRVDRAVVRGDSPEPDGPEGRGEPDGRGALVERRGTARRAALM
ncbi:hypothetical protein GCM10010335_58440 [Streptomyces galbus]|nr:hypothetical protein GCM10010335_58440 [Streptomyces galbus]